jgi:hypothetical protein
MSEALDNLHPFPGAEDFARKPSRFKRELFNSVALGDFRWLAKGLWPEVGVCFLGGPSGSGKSFLSLLWATQICRGLPVLGFKSKRAGVVYVGAEDAGGIRLRMVGLRQEIGRLEGDHLELIGQAPDLTDPEDVADLRETLEQSRSDMASRGIRLGLVVIDTMSAATGAADENAGKDMKPVLRALESMATELGFLVLMVAHTGHSETHRLRGWSGLRADAAGLIMLDERQKGEPGKITVVKVKNGEDGQTFGYNLRTITLGYDEDGDPITTCVVEDCEAPGGKSPGRPAKEGETRARIVHEAYGVAFDERAVVVKAPGANGAKGVELERLREHANRKSFYGPAPVREADQSEADHAAALRSWRKSRDTAFNRALTQLRGEKKLMVADGMAWEPSRKKGGDQ